MKDKPSPIRLSGIEEAPFIYTNMARLGHTRAEFIIDLARFLPGETEARVLARVVMTPLAAKLLHRALGESIARYEAINGEIPLQGGPSLADMLFRPPKDNPPSES